MARPPVKGPVIIPNCAELKLKFTQNGVNFSNVLHAELIPTGPINPSVAESIFSGIKAAAATTAWRAFMEANASFAGVEVKDLRAANQTALVSTGAAVSGTGTELAISQGSAMVITLRTDQSGRGFVGRVYLGGIDVSTMANARNFTTAALNAGVAWVQAINGVVTPLLGRLVLAQRALAADPSSQNPAMTNPRPAATKPILTVTYADTRIDSQRRRLGR